MNTNPKSIQCAKFRSPNSALRTLFVLFVTFCSSFLVRAQTVTNSPPPPPAIPGAGSTVAQWFTGQNTNLSWQDVTIWDGPVYLNNVNVANEFGGSCDLWRSGTNSASVLFAAVEGRTRQAGVAGTFVSQNAGAEFGWMKYDVRLGAFFDGVYRNNITIGDAHDRLGVELGLFADRKLSENTGLGFFVSYQSGQKYPLIGAQLNVSFGNGNGFLGLFQEKMTNH
jgi:hypothetical protein